MSARVLESSAPFPSSAIDRRTAGLPFAQMCGVLFLCSLWDFYVPSIGIRVLDFVALAYCGFWVAWRVAADLRGPAFVVDRPSLLAFLVAWAVTYSAVGVITSAANVKPVLGILMGVSVFAVFHTIRIQREVLVRAVAAVMIGHVVFLIVQDVYYYASGVVLNPFSVLGVQPRAISLIFRPTGLFLEPASYSVSMSMLIALRRLLLGRFDWLAALGLLSIVLTMSLWGIAAVAILLVITLRRKPVFWLGLGLLLSLLSQADFSSTVFSVAANRLSDLSRDASARTRYGGLMGMDVETVSSASFWFGSGVSNDYQQLGANGLGYLWNAGGALGLIAFLSILYLLTPHRRRTLTLFLILLHTTAAPLWTTAYWWLWLALITRSVPASQQGRT